MRMRGRSLVAALLAFSLGCGPRQPDGSPPAASVSGSRDSSAAATAPLVGTYWRIRMLDTMSVASTDSGPRAPHLQLTQSGDAIRYSATVGCNGIGGEATLTGDNITFGPGISTKMFCEALNALEVQLHSVLTRSRRWSITARTLELRDGTGRAIASLEAK
jgi:heat shock protein HslJ